jgi:hypothetical protein
MKTKYTEVEQKQIKEYQEKSGVSRKTAIRHLFKTNAPRMAKVVDVKSAAANDKPESTPAPVKEGNKLLSPTERGAARAEGLRLYKLAGRPKKTEFVRVFGKRGPLMTWEQRAAAVELSSAEEVAEKFQSLLKKASR